MVRDKKLLPSYVFRVIFLVAFCIEIVVLGAPRFLAIHLVEISEQSFLLDLALATFILTTHRINLQSPQHQPHRTSMHNVLPTTTHNRLPSLRRPLPNNLLLLLRPNTKHPRLPRHSNKRPRLPFNPPLKQRPLHVHPPPHMGLRPHRHRRHPLPHISRLVLQKTFNDYHSILLPRFPISLPLPPLRFYESYLSRRAVFKS